MILKIQKLSNLKTKKKEKNADLDIIDNLFEAEKEENIDVVGDEPEEKSVNALGDSKSLSVMSTDYSQRFSITTRILTMCT